MTDDLFEFEEMADNVVTQLRWSRRRIVVLERALQLACEDTASREKDLPDRVQRWYIQKAELEAKKCPNQR